MKTKYRKIIDWSENDQCFVVRVPELDGVITHGDTEIEAIEHAEEAIEQALKDWVKKP